ncbi:DUF1223 domain-containing protein [Sphingomonas sanxanigenens]|nr:DUF1223 domain-containing protein [Sphingomonas sanxanigenens]
MRSFMVGAVGVGMAVGGLMAAGPEGAGKPPAAPRIAAKDAALRPAAAAPPVVVELFTSQGCSSCPPADALLAALAREPGVVAITRPVTYWDRLGWKDTLAREENTTLQRAYAARGGTGAGVYTPQAVVQGGAAMVGSRGQQLRQTIAAARRVPQPAIAASRTGVVVDGSTARPVSVRLLALTEAADVAIGTGENGGRRVRYTNVVRGEKVLGEWRGGKVRFALPARALAVPGADRYAVILREGAAGPILGGRFL